MHVSPYNHALLSKHFVRIHSHGFLSWNKPYKVMIVRSVKTMLIHPPTTNHQESMENDLEVLEAPISLGNIF